VATGNVAVTAKKALFKDNDCGLKGNKSWKDSGTLQSLSHVDKNTYHQIMELYKFIILGSGDTYLSKQLAMNSSERSEFKSNLTFVASTLNRRCQTGRLYTDLNLKSFFRGEAQETNCGPSLDQMQITPAKELSEGEEMARKSYNVRTVEIFNESVVDGKYVLSDLSKLGITTSAGDVLRPVQDDVLAPFTKAEVMASNGALKDYIGQMIYVARGVFSAD